MTDRRFFTATQLKFVALFTMLLDHLYATVLHGQLWMTYVGRIAFPCLPLSSCRAICTRMTCAATPGASLCWP